MRYKVQDFAGGESVCFYCYDCICLISCAFLCLVCWALTPSEGVFDTRSIISTALFYGGK